MRKPPDWFESPEARFRTAAFWFWHRIPTAGEIAAQLADMKAKGLGCVMIQARPALDRAAYLSPAYLAAYRLACRTAKRLGLAVAIYDEYGWMCGHGGGRTVDGADHLRERHLFWASGPPGQTLSISGIRSPFLDFLGDLGRNWIYEGAAPVWGEWRAVAALAHPPGITDTADIRVLGREIELHAQGNDGCRIALVPPEGLPADWLVTVFVSARCLTSRLVNYLLPESAERFAETVYAPLLEAAEGAADGFFFDHPYAGFYEWNELEGGDHAGALGNSLLSDGELAGPAEALSLLSLVRDVGPAGAGLRAGFLDAYARRLHEAFFGTLRRWTASRGLGFTGHELLPHVGGWSLHGGLTGMDPRVMPGADPFGVDAYRTETSVDAADFAPQLAAKLGDSVARAHGRRRCTVEQYATGREAGRPTLAGQWDLTPRRFRAQAIRHLLLGARRILLHAVHVSDGFAGGELSLANPRWDFPPAYNLQPWWEDGPALFTELARLSAFLEEGEALRPVALLYPRETIRVEGASHICGEAFGLWAEALARAGLGFDILDEAMLGASLGEGGAYSTLVLPGVTSLADSASLEAIRDFARRGGRVLASEPPLTRWGEAGEDASIASALGDRVPSTAAAVAQAVAALPRPVPDLSLSGEGASWTSLARRGGDWRLAAFNDTDQPRDLTLVWPEPGAEIVRWCARTGALTQPRALAPTANGFTLPLQAGELLCLTIGAASPFPPPSPAPARPEDATVREAITLSHGWTLQIGAAPPVPIRVDLGWEEQGFAAFSGTGFYRATLTLPPRTEGRWHLEIAGFRDVAELWADGACLGKSFGPLARFPLPARAGAPLDVELRLRNTAANRMYPSSPLSAERFPSGLLHPPRLVLI